MRSAQRTLDGLGGRRNTHLAKGRAGSFRHAAYCLVAVFLGSVVGLVMVEGLLRYFAPEYSYTYIWPPNLETAFLPQPSAIPGVKGPSQFKINSQGIRGPEMSKDRRAEYRILAVGGSTTECLYLDQSRTWPHLLGQRLGVAADGRQVWVGNVGKSGTNTRHHILAIERVVSGYDVDAVIILTGINDLGLLLAQGKDYDPQFMEKRENHLSLLQSGFSVFSEPGPALPFYKRTRIWALAGSIQRELRVWQGPVQEERGLFYMKVREYRRAGEILPTLPDLRAGLNEFERNITQLADLSKRHSLRAVFLTQPFLWKRGLTSQEAAMLWLGGVGRFTEAPGHKYYSAEALAEGMDAYNSRLLYTCTKLGLECIDLNTAVPKNLTMFYDDAHFTDRGAERVAEIVAAYFAARTPFSLNEIGKGL